MKLSHTIKRRVPIRLFKLSKWISITKFSQIKLWLLIRNSLIWILRNYIALLDWYSPIVLLIVLLLLSFQLFLFASWFTFLLLCIILICCFQVLLPKRHFIANGFIHCESLDVFQFRLADYWVLRRVLTSASTWFQGPVTSWMVALLMILRNDTLLIHSATKLNDLTSICINGSIIVLAK